MSTHEQSLNTGGDYQLPVLPKRRMTEEEFVAWCGREDVRAEWIDGDVVIMSPNSTEHVDLFGFLNFILRGFVEKHDLGRVLGSELYVRLAGQKRRRLPDLLFVTAARESLLKKAHFDGAPDLIIEIISEESEDRDRHEKHGEYEEAGVREYWVIDPISERVEVHVLGANQKYERVTDRNGWLHSVAIPGFRLKIDWLWQATRPKAIDALAELNGPSA